MSPEDTPSERSTRYSMSLNTRTETRTEKCKPKGEKRRSHEKTKGEKQKKKWLYRVLAYSDQLT